MRTGWVPGLTGLAQQRERGRDRGELGVGRRRVDAEDRRAVLRGHRGMFPCLRGDVCARLERAMASARVSARRVAWGSITLSM